MTNDEIKRLRTICDAATPGPWPATESAIELDGSDAMFAIAARTALPAALNEIERLRSAVTAVAMAVRENKRHILDDAIDTCKEIERTFT